MKINENEVFAVEIEDFVYHLDHVPEGTEVTEENLIMKDDKENDHLYFCDLCKKQIV